jgi:hypothetical protein
MSNLLFVVSEAVNEGAREPTIDDEESLPESAFAAAVGERACGGDRAKLGGERDSPLPSGGEIAFVGLLEEANAGSGVLEPEVTRL